MQNQACTAADGSLVALVDCDTFYASCERVCRPDLEGKPIVVLSNNDGCIVARSREAKKLGIPMGEPEFQIRPLLEKNNVAVFSSNYTLYGDLSHRVMQVIAKIAPEIEIYSIDECFVRLTGSLAANAENVAREIRSMILKWIGLPVSIGIAPTKTLAKIATRVAKKYPAYDGIFNMGKSRKINQILEWTHISDIWGLGRKGALKLRTIGIDNARQMRDADPMEIKRLLTVTGLNTQMELNGIPSIREEIPVSHNTIISSRSLGYKVSTLEPMREAIAFHASRAAEKLRSKKHEAGVIGVRIQTAYYRDDLPGHDEMIMISLPCPTSDSMAITSAAEKGLLKIFRPGYGYAKAMVMLTDLSNPAKGQHNMLDLIGNGKEMRERRNALMGLMDRLNRLDGRGTLVIASQGPKDASWHMKRDRLSPSWTTNLQEILKVGD